MPGHGPGRRGLLLALATLIIFGASASAIATITSWQGRDFSAPGGTSVQPIVAHFAATGKEPTFTATIDWGDGTAPSDGEVLAGAQADEYDVRGQHTYPAGGRRYTTHITLHEDDGSPDRLATGTATIDGGGTTNPPPPPPPSGAPPTARLSGPSRTLALGEPGTWSAGGSRGSGLRYRFGFDGAPSGAFGAVAAGGHRFGTYGAHSVTVEVVDTAGRRATASLPVTIWRPPSTTVRLSRRRPIAGRPFRVKVKNASHGAKAALSLVSFGDKVREHGTTGAFSFGSMAPTHGGIVSHTFKRSGPQTMHVRTADAGGLASDLWAKLNVVSPTGKGKPKGNIVAAFSAPTDAYAGFPVTFVDQSTDPNAPAIGTPGGAKAFGSRSWTFSGGTPAKVDGSIAETTFAKPGFHFVSLKATDATGHTSTLLGHVDVKKSPSICSAIFRADLVRLEPVGDCFRTVAMDGYQRPTLAAPAMSIGKPSDGLIVTASSGLVTLTPGNGIAPLDPKATLRASYAGKVVHTGPIDIDSSHLNQPTVLPGFINTEDKGAVGGLAVTGGDLTFGGSQNAPTVLRRYLAAPEGYTNTLTVDATNGQAQGPKDVFEVTLPNLDLAPGIGGTDIKIRHDAEGWSGGGNFLFFGSGLQAPLSPPDTGFGFGNGGGFRFAGGKATFPKGAITLFEILELRSLRGSVSLHPLKINGGINVDSVAEVPALGAPVFSVDGCVSVVVSQGGDAGKVVHLCDDDRHPNSYSVPSGGETLVRASGLVSFLGLGSLEGAMNYHSATHSVEVGVSVDKTVAYVIKLHGDIGGTFQSLSAWQLNVSGSASLTFIDAVGGRAYGLVSAKGIGACAILDAKLTSISAGATYRWGAGSPKLIWSGCNMRRLNGVAVFPASAAARITGRSFSPLASAGARTASAPLAPGRGVGVVALKGRTGPPHVTVQGPHGERMVDTGGARVSTKVATVYRSTQLKTSYVLIPRPSAGRWRFVPRPGSPEIASVEHGYAAPIVKPRGHVGRPGRPSAGRAGLRRLTYRLGALAGAKATLVEEGKDVAHPLGSVPASGRGSLRFRPAPGRPGTRRIVALVTRDGLPAGRRVVARFRAGKPVVLGAPRRLRVTRAKTTLRARWARVAGARSYRVTVTLGSGRKLVRTVRGSRLAVARNTKYRTAKVVVRAVGADGRTGRAATRRAAALKYRPHFRV
jgi:hypothetical protein